VQASVVVPVDPAGSDVLDVGEGLVGAVVEDGRGDRLGLEQSDDRFHQGLGVGIAHGADRGSDALQLEVLVNRMDVYCSGHRSGAAAGPARPGSLCRSGSHNAIRSGVRTRSVTLVVAACQPTIRWANTSTTKAT
jgi:hypothetical protein